jgi:hypothetical protein
MWRGTLALLFLLLPVLTLGQSLGDVARKEKERREDNRKRGEKATLVVREIGSNDEDEEWGGSSASPVVGTSSPQVEDSAPRVSTEEDRAQQEMEWRRRNSEARERVAEARKRYDLLSKLHLTSGSYYVDENNEPVITSVEQLQTMVAQAKAELDAATEAGRQLREDARRAGVPPGWVR